MQVLSAAIDSVMRGAVRCLHDKGREISSTQDNLQKEVDHLC